MLSENQKLLIHRAVDGELTESEKAEFHLLLEASAEARKFYNQMDNIDALTKSLGTVEAPGQLRADVLRALRESKSRASSPRSLGATFGVLLSPRLAFGLAAGLVIGLGVGALTLKTQTGQLDPLTLSGTILGGTNPETLVRVDSDSFVDGSTKGYVTVDVAKQLYYIQIEIESAQEVSADVEYDPSGYVVRAFEQAVSKPGNIVSGAGQIRTSHSGRNRYLFVLEHISETELTPVVVRIAGANVTYERSIEM